MHDAADMGRFVAVCGWLAWQVRRPFRRSSQHRAGNVPVYVLVALLVLLATVPIVVPLLDEQPVDVSLDDVITGDVSAPGTWIRAQGRVFWLETAPTTERGDYGLLVDAERLLTSIVVRAPEPLPEIDPEDVEIEAYSGRLVPLSVVVDTEALPIEATQAGTPPEVIEDLIFELDASTKPERTSWWPLALLPALLAVMLVIGARAGYPVFRQTKEVDVLAAPLGVGERLPAAWGGRIGPNQSELADPLGALLLVRRGTTGNVLTAQPLADEGPAPTAVAIGGGWTTGRIGYVHALRETVPALAIRSELVDAIFLFARTAERDRVAALVTMDR
jgi:hypothetical protein